MSKKEGNLDAGQKEAAFVLATNGYVKGEKRRCGAVPAAARAAGVTRSTVYEWLRRSGFQELIEQIKAERITMIWQRLEKATEKLNVTACIYALKVLKPEIYDDQYRRQILANQGLQQAVAALPELRIVSAGEPPTAPKELLPFMADGSNALQ